MYKRQGFERGCFKLIEGRMAKNEDEIVIPRHLKTNGRIDIKVGAVSYTHLFHAK